MPDPGVTFDMTTPFPPGLVVGGLVKNSQMGLGKVQAIDEAAGTVTVQFVFFYPGVVIRRDAVTTLTPVEVIELYTLVMSRTTDPDSSVPFMAPCVLDNPGPDHEEVNDGE